MMEEIKLPKLEYNYHDLDSFVGTETMQIHYEKHHATYVNNLKLLLDKTEEKQPNKSDLANFIFNGGGHINHTLFWRILSPKNRFQNNASKDLKVLMDVSFGGIDHWQDCFMEHALSIKGSGWCWLVYNRDTNTLSIITTLNQDPVLSNVLIPILGLDMWEHAYYLKFKNDKKQYINSFFDHINWHTVSMLLQQREELHKGLKSFLRKMMQ